MKKILLTLFILICSLSFGEIKDNIGLFSEDDKTIIEAEISKLEKEKDIKVYLNTVVGQESFQLENPQKTFIITYQEIGKNIVVTELKFTEDLKMGNKSQDVDIILDSLKDYAFNKDYVNYSKVLINEIGKLIEKVDEEEEYIEPFPEDSASDKKGFLRRVFSRNP